MHFFYHHLNKIVDMVDEMNTQRTQETSTNIKLEPKNKIKNWYNRLTYFVRNYFDKSSNNRDLHKSY